MTFDERPSVFNPLFRRLFANEGQREERETEELYARVGHQEPYTLRHIVSRVNRFFGEVPDDLLFQMRDAVEAIAAQESYLFKLERPHHMTLAEFVDFRNLLRHKQYFLDHHAEIEQKLHEALVSLFCAIADDLPKTAQPSPFTIPLIYAMPQPAALITQLFNVAAEEQYRSRLILRPLAEQLALNIYAASNVVPVPGEPPRQRLTPACDSKLPLDELNDQYCAATPFRELFRTPVPLKFTQEDRFNHMHVVGGTGAGKTTLLQNLILHDLESEHPPALIVIDSQGDLIRKLSHLALFDGRLADRFVLITPKDIDHPPALNIFDLNRKRLGAYDQLVKEQVIAGAIQTFDYLFSGLLGADLTAKQGVFFKYVARLMLSLPEAMGRNATILDMLHLMEDPAPYKKAIDILPPLQRAFFERDFHSKTFAQTKDQIRYRLQAIIENPTLARLFTTPETKVDLFTELNRGSIILVDTAKDFLKGSSSHFGRIFISLVLQAVLERAAIPEGLRKPAFLIVDEAAAYFDSNIDDLLTETRKYKLGCVFAHQYLDQCTPSLRASLAANTSIKFAGGLSTADARHMAPDMRTTADFILGQPRLHFACHIRNVTPQAVSIPVPVGLLEEQPQLTCADYDELLERNRERVSLGRQASQPGEAAKWQSATAPTGAPEDDPAAAAPKW